MLSPRYHISLFQFFLHPLACPGVHCSFCFIPMCWPLGCLWCGFEPAEEQITFPKSYWFVYERNDLLLTGSSFWSKFYPTFCLHTSIDNCTVLTFNFYHFSLIQRTGHLLKKWGRHAACCVKLVPSGSMKERLPCKMEKMSPKTFWRKSSNQPAKVTHLNVYIFMGQSIDGSCISPVLLIAYCVRTCVFVPNA